MFVRDDSTGRLRGGLAGTRGAGAPEQLLLPREQPDEDDDADGERDDDKDMRLAALIRCEVHGVHSTRRAAVVSITSAGSAGIASGSAYRSRTWMSEPRGSPVLGTSFWVGTISTRR